MTFEYDSVTVDLNHSQVRGQSIIPKDGTDLLRGFVYTVYFFIV